MGKKEGKIFFVDDFLSHRFSSLKGKYKYNWIEENTFLKKQNVLEREDHVGISFSFYQSRYFLIFSLCVFLFFFCKIFYLQIIKGNDYRALAEGNRIRNLPIVSERGLIFDRNGIQLTKNVPGFALAVFPQDIPKEESEREKLVKKLSELTGREYKDIYDLLEEYRKYTYESVVIQDNLDYDTAILAQIHSADFPGVHIQSGSRRLYTPYGEENTESIFNSFSHVLGYQGKIGPDQWKVYDEKTKDFIGLYTNGYLPNDLIGKTGVEKTYEAVLRGVYGKRQIEVDARGKEQHTIAEVAPVAGKHLKLTIDAKIQENLERIMLHYMDTAKKSRASGIVMNPNNGEILAIVSIPGFNNNDFSGGISQEKYSEYVENENNPLFNRSIAGTYPSGSVVKPALGASALYEGIISPNTSFLSNGGLRIGQWFFPDWQSGGHGITNLRKAIAWSVNTFFYYIGGGYQDFEGLGVEKIVNYLKLFGLNEKLGVDIPGEASGFLPSKEWKERVKGEQWYVGDTYNLSIGQGDLLVTPLQIASLTSVIANGGTLYTPHVGLAFFAGDGNKLESIQTPIIRENILNKESLRESRLGMRDCVTYGACSRLSLLPFSSAGKTGTAQWSSVKANHAWFTSFAPFDNPEIVVTILVEEGEGGSTIAAPIAYDFYRWWWGYKKQ
ncbi:MAG: penicillin-binding protein 2 [Candidatus Magasanikbacteria bacterium]